MSEPTTIRATVLADSLNEATGDRCTSFLLVMPKWLLAQFNTHRQLSRSASSSRAVPLSKTISQVLRDPFVPVRFGRAKRGMQDAGSLTGVRLWLCRQLHLKARYAAVAAAWLQGKLGLHKQAANRLLEPWMWAHVVATATQWENFYRLRVHADAQPEFHELALRMLEAHAASEPRRLRVGNWHLPFADGDLVVDAIRRDLKGDEALDYVLRRCAARIARASYVNHYGRNDPDDDLRLFDDLAGASPPHLSPLDHCCQAMAESTYSGHLKGFESHRKKIPGESGERGPLDPKALLAELTAAEVAS